MKKAHHTIGILALTVVLSAMGGGAFAQQAQDAKTTAQPLFVTPYKPNVATYESGMPVMVRGTPNNRTQASRTYTSPNRKSGPVIYDATNQFRSDVGRITSEQTFYDEQTGNRYGQYEYMGVLASRGDTAKLRQVVGDIQKNGVFDPAKYQAAVSGGQNASTGGGGSSQGGGLPRAGGDTTKRTFVVKGEGDNLPQKIHRGYDDEEETAPANTVRKPNQPIFLR